VAHDDKKHSSAAIDEAAFEANFQTYEAALFRYVCYLAGSSSSAEDIYQETWLRVARHLSRGKTVRNFKSFLFATATNIFRDELRKCKVRHFFLGPSLDDTTCDESIWLSSQETQDQIGFNETLQQSLEALTPKQRTMFCLSYIEEFKIAEISQIMQCAEGTVKATLFKVVRKLRRDLSEYRNE
jgi:RNA polymerase sigma-70 factor (ECF subfamily)